MGGLGIRQSVLDARTDQQKAAFWGVARTLHLGVPVVKTRPSTGVAYYTYQDAGISPLDCAYLSALAANLGDIPANWHVPMLPSLRVDVPALRRQVRAFVEARIVLPLEEPLTENPWQEAIEANGAPSGVLLAAEIVPADWTVVAE